MLNIDFVKGIHGEPKGTIIAISLPRYVKEALYMEGGIEPHEMHITLVYLESPIDLYEVRRVCSEFAAHPNHCPIEASVGGIGRFIHEFDDVLYASIDSPDLARYRECLVKCLNKAGIFESKEHGFTPHCTIKYVSKDEPTPNLSEDACQSWIIDKIDLWHNNFRYKYILG